MTTTTDEHTDSGQPSWCDELVRLDDQWMLAKVTTPEGRKVTYRIFTGPPGQFDGIPEP